MKTRINTPKEFDKLEKEGKLVFSLTGERTAALMELALMGYCYVQVKETNMKVKLITQCGSERMFEMTPGSKMISVPITDGESGYIGRRFFKADPFRDGEFREVSTEYNKSSAGKEYKKEIKGEWKTEQKNYKNVNEIVKDFTLQELIDMKIKESGLTKQKK